MSSFTFKKFTIVAGGTPQPLVGTTLSSATVAAYSPQDPGIISVAVADSSVFDILGLGAGPIKTPAYAVFDIGSSEERVPIFEITDATHIKVQYLQKAHASGAYVRCGMAVAGTYIQTTDGNAGYIYVGNRPTMVIATMKYVVSKLATVVANSQPVDFSDSRDAGVNSSQISDWWVDGTTGDGYVPSFGAM